jgi:glycosyltransferase involved in cell wall biosynthesis
MRILHLIDALDGSGSARQLQLLAPALVRAGIALEICSIGPPSQQAADLRDSGIAVHVLGWTRWLDAGALWRLRELVRGGFDLVHVWRLAALRPLAVVASEMLPRTIVSGRLARSSAPRWWDRQALGRVRCTIVAREEDRQHGCQRGLTNALCQTLVTAVARTPATTVPSWAAPYPQRVVCTGRLERGHGFREAIWAVDILRYVFPNVHLLIAGAGPFRGDLDSMIQRLNIHNAHLLGDAVDPAELLGVAQVCWVPSRTDCGAQAALEAMAQGQAVVASDVPCLRALIRDGETGCLVRPGDPVALARRTRALLADPALARRLGDAARADVASRFNLPLVASRWHALYNDLAA